MFEMIQNNNQEIFQESIDSFTVTFGGDSNIDAELFAKTINNTIALVKISSHIVDPNSFLRLEIRSNEEGSFKTCIDAIARYSVDLLTQDNIKLAVEIVGVFLALLGLKKHLNGEAPKEVKIGNNNYDTIVNQENATLSVDKRISKAYFKDCKIDQHISYIFNDIKEGKRGSLAIEGNDKKIVFPEESFEAMRKNIVGMDNSLQGTEDTQTIERCELLIKKVDFIGNSKWEMIFDKKILVTIKDEQFIKKVKNGLIKISGGYRLVCSLEIKKQIDENYEVHNVEYTINKVHEIKDNKMQPEMF